MFAFTSSPSFYFFFRVNVFMTSLNRYNNPPIVTAAKERGSVGRYLKDCVGNESSVIFGIRLVLNKI